MKQYETRKDRLTYIHTARHNGMKHDETRWNRQTRLNKMKQYETRGNKMKQDATRWDRQANARHTDIMVWARHTGRQTDRQDETIWSNMKQYETRCNKMRQTDI